MALENIETQTKTLFDEMARATQARVTGTIDLLDYVKDGLLYCHKCNTPLQVDLSKHGINAVVYCMCKCRREAVEAEEQRFRIGQKLNTISEKMREFEPLNIISSRLAKADLMTAVKDKRNIQVIKLLEDFIANFDQNPQGLIISGSVGTGKTYLTAGACNTLVRSGYKALFTSTVKVTNLGFENADLLNRLGTIDLLAIDDLGTERKTDYSLEQVYRIIDDRYNANRPLIVTTNLDLNNIKAIQDISLQRIFDRLLEMCKVVKLHGNSRRGQINGL